MRSSSCSGPARQDDAVAVGGAGVHGRAGRGDLEDPAVNVIGRQIDDGKVRSCRIRNDQAARDHLAMGVLVMISVVVLIGMVVMIIVMIRLTHLVVVIVIIVRELHGIDEVTERDYPGLIRAGAV